MILRSVARVMLSISLVFAQPVLAGQQIQEKRNALDVMTTIPDAKTLFVILKAYLPRDQAARMMQKVYDLGERLDSKFDFVKKDGKYFLFGKEVKISGSDLIFEGQKISYNSHKNFEQNVDAIYKQISQPKHQASFFNLWVNVANATEPARENETPIMSRVFHGILAAIGLGMGAIDVSEGNWMDLLKDVGIVAYAAGENQIVETSIKRDNEYIKKLHPEVLKFLRGEGEVKNINCSPTAEEDKAWDRTDYDQPLFTLTIGSEGKRKIIPLQIGSNVATASFRIIFIDSNKRAFRLDATQEQAAAIRKQALLCGNNNEKQANQLITSFKAQVKGEDVGASAPAAASQATGKAVK